MTVIVHGRDKARATAEAEHILSAGGQAEVAIGDLAGDEGADAVANAALARGPVDIPEDLADQRQFARPRP